MDIIYIRVIMLFNEHDYSQLYGHLPFIVYSQFVMYSVTSHVYLRPALWNVANGHVFHTFILPLCR